MDAKKYHFAGIGAGGLSILAIFVVLCLTTFAALSFMTARADRTLSRKAADAARAYYAADTQAERRLAELIELAAEDDWNAALERAGFSVEAADGEAVVRYRVPAGETKELCAEIALALENGRPTGRGPAAAGGRRRTRPRTIPYRICPCCSERTHYTKSIEVAMA